ncbi:ATP-grasp domain-containing protein [Myroides marinus]|uniref:ATP-grasp domain-containing protein n=1 Tax=Myroides marinus TaxID=703342 RepID=UPI002577828F|nr:hypothetical protein [Myroides marinus]MDM1380713.1 hypothetical protein [Myroides marinus]MDM1387973.1 hypothetical protein [Myroides marinus]MDM1395197.1 hypothetical protein [Myroides marinus]
MLAIHSEKGSYSDEWIKYCESNNIDFKIVDCYSTDIIRELKGCSALMWHHNHGLYKDVLVAKKLIRSLEKSGMKVYPNSDSNWHFDDKVAQKYLLEAVDLPLVKSYVFYDKNTAMKWVNTTSFPKVFKLKGGASSQNVRLVHNKNECEKIIKRSFGRGWKQYDAWVNVKEKYRLSKQDGEWKRFLKALVRVFIAPYDAKMIGNEKGYVYFQDFIPNNTCDFRIQIVGDKAWAMRRMVRKNDFRASGSNMLDYDQTEIPVEMINNTFEVHQALNMPTIAVDYVLDSNNAFKIVEICYCFGIADDELNHGYWTKDLVYHNKRFNPFGDMIDFVLK